MDKNIAMKLEEVRKRLAEMTSGMSGEGDEAWGPGSKTDSDYEDSEAGVGGADNVSDVNDTFDAYLLSILDSLTAAYDLDEEAAIDFIFDVIDSLVEDGTLPEIPDESDLKGSAQWAGVAKTFGLAELVLSIAESESEEE